MNLLNYESEIVSLAKFYGEIEVKIVPDIKFWCEQNGVPEDSTNRMGKCLQILGTEKYVILLKQEISESQLDNVVCAMELRGSSEYHLSLICSEKAFIQHLVLHECAHALHSEFGELECDNWAFEELLKQKI